MASTSVRRQKGLGMMPFLSDGVQVYDLAVVDFFLSVIRPAHIGSSTEYIHAVADSRCRMKVPPSGRISLQCQKKKKKTDPLTYCKKAEVNKKTTYVCLQRCPNHLLKI